MRASPAFEVSLHRFGVWRGAVLLLGALGVASLVAWALTREGSVDGALMIACAAAMGILLWLTVSLVRVPAVGLRWDGLLWHLGPPGASADKTVSGDLTVVIDLGPWMLLRFKPAAPEVRHRVTWLPVQRRGIETQWHALRCSVYSPHPAPAANPPVGP